MPREATTTAEYTLRDQQMMSRATNYFSWQARMAEERIGKRVVEIGCGMGNFTGHLEACEMVCGLDIVDDCLDAARERFRGDPRKQFCRLDVQDESFLELAPLRADTVVCLNVLEHIRDDRRALQHMHRILAPGGRAILILPAFEALYGPIDEKLGHFRRYTKHGWKQLAEECGFTVETSRFFNVVGFFGWWVNARVLRRTEQSEGQIALFDSVLVPIFSRLEPLIGPPVGQSIFTVIRKPA